MGFYTSSGPPLILLLSLFAASTIAAEDQPPLPGLPPSEQEATYLALESIDPETAWRSLFPDDLCLAGPHGVVCDLLPDGTLHVTELNFGYLSDFSANPACGPNATLSPVLSSSAASAFPFLRKLFFYNCFTHAKAALPGRELNLPSSLEELVFVQNPSLVGRLSGRIRDLPRLRRLIISSSGISGNIPAEIGKLRSLEQVVLSENRLRGGIPATIGRCRSLKILDLSGNRIGGDLPVEIGRLGELVKLDLSSNLIRGSFPVELGRLQRLEFLDVRHNRLTGGVPTALAEMASMREVYLSGNPMGGRIPEIWEKLGGILGVGMSGLGLVGNIPSTMGVFLENVRYLALDGNFLEGKVPEQFKRLERSAGEINLENNALQGRIPFSAGFVDRLGGKLKLAGNPKLCLGEDLVGHVSAKGSLTYLERCNKTEIPYPVDFRYGSGLSIAKISPWLFVSFSCLLLVFR
ncbi:piriformospora indica-insensitive protein 2 [Phoenix dactylifera]|uniref:Piriformospora indica-insensitive protein 2 n=1 Tax=Phoenix dactylifera TaxID=42345 RepID=A0A8B7C0W1_PHODC|nr:piriformospora indica-insensitive protein 2 [Phoenix dactylifera]